MDSNEANRQIDQMVAFIQQEASEKAEEIRVKTDREFMAEKLSLEQQLAAQITTEHEKKKKDFLIQKRIEKSKLLSETRFSVMRRRDDKINELKAIVLTQLTTVAQSAKYSELLRFLIAQGLQTLLEKEVTIQCRKEDLALVEQELPKAMEMFQSNMEKNCNGIKPTCVATLDKENFLAAAPKEGQSGASCAGGVVLSAREGQIVCRNTLDQRLDLAFNALKPNIRGALFGERAKPPNAAENHH